MNHIEAGINHESEPMNNAQKRCLARVALLRENRELVEMSFGNNWWNVRPGDMVVADRILADHNGPTGFIAACGIGPFTTLYRMYNPEGSERDPAYSLDRSLLAPLGYKRKTKLGTSTVKFEPKNDGGRAFLFEEQDLTILRPYTAVRNLAQKYTRYSVAGEILKNMGGVFLVGSMAASGLSLSDSASPQMYNNFSATGLILGLSALYGASQCDVVCQRLLALMGDKYRDYFPNDLELQDFFQRVF